MRPTKLFLAAVLVVLAAFAVGKAHAQTASITLDWTAPGDDGNVGTATTYEMRWRPIAPDTTSQATILTWWNLATIVTGLPNPQVAGTSQSVIVSPSGGFAPGTYYFIMRAADEVPNVSTFSNTTFKVIVDTVAPARVTDLRVR